MQKRDFVTRFEKYLVQLKALQKRVQKDENKYFVAQSVPEIYGKNERLKNSGMCFFVIDCTTRKNCNMHGTSHFWNNITSEKWQGKKTDKLSSSVRAGTQSLALHDFYILRLHRAGYR